MQSHCAKTAAWIAVLFDVETTKAHCYRGFESFCGKGRGNGEILPITLYRNMLAFNAAFAKLLWPVCFWCQFQIAQSATQKEKYSCLSCQPGLQGMKQRMCNHGSKNVKNAGGPLLMRTAMLC